MGITRRGLVGGSLAAAALIAAGPLRTSATESDWIIVQWEVERGPWVRASYTQPNGGQSWIGYSDGWSLHDAILDTDTMIRERYPGVIVKHIILPEQVP